MLMLVCTCVHPSSSFQARLSAGEEELEVLRAQLATAGQWDAFRIAYRHDASLDPGLAALTLRAQCWPKDLAEVFKR
jgi:hypothetical protein